MRVSRLRLAALAAAGSVALSGCAYDMYGDPYGYGYAPYSSVSVGVGYGGGYGGYGYGNPYGGYGGYGGYGSYYGGYDPFGWYGDFYYPGSGIYVYDRSRNRHQWNDDQRRYWESRRDRWQHQGGSAATTQNWSGWDRSHWRNSGSTGDRNRSNWQSRSSVTTSGVRVRSSDDGANHHRSRETSDERPQ
jgi:hypothetical protein